MVNDVDANFRSDDDDDEDVNVAPLIKRASIANLVIMD